MKKETSGSIYQISLDYEMGYAYVELLDFSDTHRFNGILVQVYNYHGKIGSSLEDTINDIVSSGIMIKYLPIVDYPKTKGKDAWKFIGKRDDFLKESPYFKEFKGIIFEEDDWSNLSPWIKSNDFSDNPEYIICEYEEVRNLETLTLNHAAGIKEKIIMLHLIKEGNNVNDFYNLKNRGKRNLYLQIINTYFDKDKAKELIEILPVED